MRLTEFSIRALSVEKGQRTFFDDTFKGFGVRVSQGGAKSYVLVTGKARKLTTIGRVDRLGVKEAREKARAILYAPKDEKPTLTFQAALDTFLAMRVRPNNRASTAAETQRLITRHFSSLYDRPIAGLKTGDFLAITNNLIVAGKPSEANHAFTAVKTMLRWSRGQGYIDRHPLEDATRPYKPVSRDRWLADHELAKVLATGRTGLYGLLILVLTYTGQRLAQIANLRQEWIEGDQIRFPASIMKSGQEHPIPIGPATQALLARRSTDLLFENEDGRPFANYGHAHRDFLEASGVPHFTRHDLRRTFSTGLASLGTAPHIIERILDHQSGTISGIAATYNRFHFLPEMRAAVEKWEEHLANLM